jgi:TRAP-type transport system small permease protein
MLQMIARAVHHANAWGARLCTWVAGASMAVLFVVLTANVFTRYLKLGKGQWGAEVPELVFPWLVAASVGLAAVHGAHIGISFLVERMSASTAKWAATAMALVCIALYVGMLLIVAGLLPIVKDDKSPVYGISLAWTYAAMALAFTVVLVDQLASVLKIWGMGRA